MSEWRTKDQRPDEISVSGEDYACLERIRASVLLQILTSDVHMIATRDLCPLCS